MHSQRIAGRSIGLILALILLTNVAPLAGHSSHHRASTEAPLKTSTTQPGDAVITLRRTGRTFGRVSAKVKVTVTDVTTSPADCLPAGLLDTTFNSGGAGADSVVYALALQPDGKVIVGGAFTFYNGAAPDRVLRLTGDLDADGDGACGDVDNCPTVANPDQADADADGVGDACDACPNAPANDADGDGVCGDVDNCPTDPAKTEPGACGCGVPDRDTDGDGTADCLDQCPDDPAKTNPDACGCGVPDTDTDGDGIANCSDSCPLDPNNDADGDGVCGNVDNCPATANPNQQDTDGDGMGDACDVCPLDTANDADGDGRCVRQRRQLPARR